MKKTSFEMNLFLLIRDQRGKGVIFLATHVKKIRVLWKFMKWENRRNEMVKKFMMGMLIL